MFDIACVVFVSCFGAGGGGCSWQVLTAQRHSIAWAAQLLNVCDPACLAICKREGREPVLQDSLGEQARSLL